MSEHSDHTARAENVAWLAATGESATGAARRLGITYKALEKWARRNAPEDWRRLRANDPCDIAMSERARIAAAARWAS